MTLAQELEKDNKLAGSFFFDKRITQNNSETLSTFATSLARQISRVDPSYHRALGQALEANPDIVKDDLEVQVQKLIIEPLRVSPTSTPPSTPPLLVLVFDALDECGSVDDLNTVLDLLAAFNSLPPNYRVFFSSRPQRAILQRFPFHSTGTIEDLDDKQFESSVKDDVFRFVEERFHTLIPDDPDAFWPPIPVEIGEFAGLSQGLFELAALRVRRIESAPSIGLRPRKVFDDVKDEARGLPAQKLEDELEAEYLRIIDWVYPSRRAGLASTVKLYRHIVGTFVSLREPLHLEALSRLLGLDVADVRSALRPLSSVFFVDEDSSVPIRCYHATFREFLLTIPTCSTEFHRNFLFDGLQHHLMLGLCVERLSEELSVGMCAETNDYNSLDEIPDFDVQVGTILPPHLRYCCLQWNNHLLATPNTEFEVVNATLGRFLGSCLLNWIEAMSLLREMDEAIPILVRTKNWIRSSVRSLSLYA